MFAMIALDYVALGVPILLMLWAVGSTLVVVFRLRRVHRPAVPVAVSPNARRPRVLCVGDSLTQGSVSDDVVSRLRALLPNAHVANFGVNRDLCWHVRQRLQPISDSEADVVVLLVGSNDVRCEIDPDKASQYQRERGVPEVPDAAWSAAQYDALVQELVATGAVVVTATIPPIGEDLHAPCNVAVQAFNRHIQACSAAQNLLCIDLYGGLVALLDEPSHLTPPAWSASVAHKAGRSAALQHGGFGMGLDSIGRRQGLRISPDLLHLNERGGAVWAEQMHRAVLRSLGLARQDVASK